MCVICDFALIDLSLSLYCRYRAYNKGPYYRPTAWLGTKNYMNAKFVWGIQYIKKHIFRIVLLFRYDAMLTLMLKIEWYGMPIDKALLNINRWRHPGYF